MRSINPISTNVFFLLVWHNRFESVHCIYRGVTGYNFQIKLYFFYLKIVFVLANSVDTGEMPHYIDGSFIFGNVTMYRLYYCHYYCSALKFVYCHINVMFYMGYLLYQS